MTLKVCAFSNICSRIPARHCHQCLFNAGANLFTKFWNEKQDVLVQDCRELQFLFSLNLCFFHPHGVLRESYNTKFKTGTLITSTLFNALFFFTTKMLTWSTFSPEAQTWYMLPESLCVKWFLTILGWVWTWLHNTKVI